MKTIQKQKIGVIDGKEVFQFTLDNGQIKVSAINYGGVITEISAPNRDGVYENVVLGYGGNLNKYETDSPYFGAIVGRCAGRISNASFELDGKKYDLPANDGKSQMHGGPKGFSKVVWDGDVMEDSLIFSYFSKAGEMGYPGNANVSVCYRLLKNKLIIEYKATVDERTPMTMTNHSYFNLSGIANETVHNHKLTVPSKYVLELNEASLPTGKKLNVEGTIFDLQKGRYLKEALNSKDKQIQLAEQGYDHPFELEKGVIQLEEEKSGRMLTIETTEPAVIVYSGSHLADGQRYHGICLETQGFPDAVNHNEFPSCIVSPEKPYVSTTIYRFDTF
ncbi:aldose epimerase family protein [Niallia sp. 03133]|uniref:aldose epimerase family protein n=1 Tax=Niallia sp. 03133 TaxID=3458060 RepID=UPI004043A85E